MRMTICLITLIALLGLAESALARDIASQSARRSLYDSEALYTGGTSCNTIERYMRILNPELVQGEPAIMELLLRRTVMEGVDDAEFVARMQIGLDLKIQIQPPRGPAFEYRPERVNPMAPNTVIPLRPGEFVSFHIPLAYDPESVSGALFETPGTYRIVATLACRQSRTTAKDTGEELGYAEVTVREPDTDADRAAVSMIQDYEFFRSFQQQRTRTSADRAVMERIVAEAPQSRHAPFALYALANSPLYGRPATEIYDEEPTTEDKARLQRAMLLFRKLREEHRDHPLAQTAHLRMMRLAQALGDDELARDLFIEAWQDPRLTHHLTTHGPEMRWIFGDVADRPEKVEGEWMVFLDPNHGVGSDIYLDPPRTEEEMFQEALMDAIREGRVEVRRGEGPPPGQNE